MIVMNLLRHAVTEYQIAGATGVVQHGSKTFFTGTGGIKHATGTMDDAADVEALVQTGEVSWGDTHKKLANAAYVSGAVNDKLVVGVALPDDTRYEYPCIARPDGTTRAVLGKGIRHNYLSFFVKNTASEPFVLDVLELNTATSTRRV